MLALISLPLKRCVCHFVAHAATFVSIVGVLLHPVGTDADGVAYRCCAIAREWRHCC
jgi:hypothetical protein